MACVAATGRILDSRVQRGVRRIGSWKDGWEMKVDVRAKSGWEEQDTKAKHKCRGEKNSTRVMLERRFRDLYVLGLHLNLIK